MGRYTEKFRSIIRDLSVGSPRGFTPEIASQCIAQLANGALQVIVQLEEQNEDQEKEIHRLQEQLMEAGIGGKEWQP